MLINVIFGKSFFTIRSSFLSKHLSRLGFVSICALLVTSCANMNPVLITYGKDGNSKTAEGIRYYETRPFIAVHRPFPLESKTYLVDGLLSPDGSTVEITVNVNVANEISHFSRAGTSTLKLDTHTLFAAGTFVKEAPPVAQGVASGTNATAGAGGSGDSSKDSSAGGAPNAGKEGADANDTNEEKKNSESTVGERIGYSNITVQTDNAGYSFLPINDLFSIIYLPDYDREFVVDTRGKFGLAKLNLIRGPGGALLSMSAEVDNTAVLRPILDSYTKLIGAATSIADSAITGIPIVPAAQGANGKPVVEAVPSERMYVTLRMHKVKFAAPGMYPFIKPSELRDLENLNTLNSWNNASTSGRKFLLPVLPYQVPYDYFEIIVFEHAVVPQGLSRLVDTYSKTPIRLAEGTPVAKKYPRGNGDADCGSENLMTMPSAGKGSQEIAGLLKFAKEFREHAELDGTPTFEAHKEFTNCVALVKAEFKLKAGSEGENVDAIIAATKKSFEKEPRQNTKLELKIAQ